MYESKYLLESEDFFARHPEIGEDFKALMIKDVEGSDFDMFAFILSYIFM